MFQSSWQQSDSKAAFENVLKEHGLAIANGDRRGFVATDMHGKVYALARWIGIKAKEVRARLGDAQELPSLNQAKGQLAERLSAVVARLQEEERTKLAAIKVEQEQARAAEKQKPRHNANFNSNGNNNAK